jgi:hypothetical protein
MRKRQQTNTKLHKRHNHAPCDKLIAELTTEHGGHVSESDEAGEHLRVVTRSLFFLKKIAN